MASLILLVVVAAWLAVLIPPLLRSRLENRPNSSVSDFRNQLSSLQRAMPSSRTVSMRSMGRPLAPSPLARPAAAGRPVMRSGVRTHGTGSTRSPGQQAAVRPQPDMVRVHDASLRSRTHGDRRRQAPRAAEAVGRSDARRRRANVFFVLALIAACSTFLALTTKAQGLVYLAGAAGMSIVAYAYVLGQAGRRDAPATTARPPAREYRGQRALDGDVRRERSHASPEQQPRHASAARQRSHRDTVGAAATEHRGQWSHDGARRRQPTHTRRPVDRWSPAV